MKFVLGLAAALAFVAIQTAATPVLAQQGGKSAMETGSNATDTQGASMSKGGGKMKGKKMKKKGM